MSYVTNRTGPEVDNLLTRSETSVQQADGTIVVTVGPSTEANFTTINDAITFLSRHVPVYETGVKRATIELEPGFEMEEQVLVTDQDLGWITIRSGAAADPTAIESFTEGDEVTGSDEQQEVVISIGNTAGDGSSLNGQLVLLDYKDSSVPKYFFFTTDTGQNDPLYEVEVEGESNIIPDAVEVLISPTASAQDAATALASVIDGQAEFSAESDSFNVTVENSVSGAVSIQPIFEGSLVDGFVEQRGFDVRSKTVVKTVSAHGYSVGDVIIIQDQRTPIEEVFYNGRWFVKEVISTEQFVIDGDTEEAITDNAYWDPAKGNSNPGEEGSTFASPPVTVKRSALTQVWEFFYYPAFGVARGVLPIIGAEFVMDTSSNPDVASSIFNYFDGLCATDGGEINILPGFGFQNATGSNIYGTRQSRINANGAVANFAGRHGVWAYSATIINARGVQANNCGWKSTVGSEKGLFGDAEVSEASIFGTTGFVTTGEVGEAIGSGIVATRNSIINAEGCVVTGAEGFGILAEFGSLVTIGGHLGSGTVSGNGTRLPALSIAQRNFRARGGGMITDSSGINAPVNFNSPNNLTIQGETLPEYLNDQIDSRVNGFNFTTEPKINGVDLTDFVQSIIDIQ